MVVVRGVIVTSRHVFGVLAGAGRRFTVGSLGGLLVLGVLPLMPGAAPAPAHISATPVAMPSWLARLNAWRLGTGLTVLTENTTWSQGDYNHALYMVKNDLVTHSEDPAIPFYTTAGDTAARSGNIQVSSTTATNDQQVIDWWMAAPFHAMGMMDPRLTSTGFGSYREVKSGWQEGATLDTLRGNSFSGGTYPVYFPGNGSSEPLTSYTGGEFPNPLATCPGFAAPTGLPVFVQVGGNVATTVTGNHTFTGNGVPLAHCIVDSTQQSSLTYRGGVIVIPQQPLQTGVTYAVALTVNGLPYAWSFTIGPLPVVNTGSCTSVSATTTPSSPQLAGTPVTLTTTSAGCPNPRYRFWVQPPGGSWTIAQDYGTANTFAWTGTGVAGAYNLEVDARDATESVSYDVVYNFTYQLTGCTAVSLGTNPSSPQYPNGSVLLTAVATCPGTPTYRFWVRPPGGPWTVKQDYSTTNTYSWPITGAALGSYGLEVDVRGQGATASYEKVTNLIYVLGATPCSAPALGASPSSPGATGGGVDFTATTSGCANPRYRFWVQAPGGPWTIKQDYSSANTFTWTGTGLAGSYGIEVDVRDQSATVSYDTVKNLTYAVNGCSAVALSASPANSALRGTTVTLIATATCPGTPTYKFWIKAPSGSWTVVQAYGSGSTFSWSPATPGMYSLEVDVRDQGGTDTYEKVSNLTYSVS